MTDPDDFGAAADQLNDALDQAEVLFEKRFRVGTEVQIPGGGCLQWRKTNSGWCLYVEDANQPLVKCALVIRQAAAHRLDDLWQACETAETEISKDVVEARQVVLTFLERRGG